MRAELTPEAGPSGLGLGLELDVAGPSGRVPAVLWLPGTRSPAPVVLLGHGGSRSKRSERVVRLAKEFTRHDLAALAIDGPFHGERVDAPVEAAEYQARMVELGVESVIQGMVADWTSALARAADTGGVDPGRCGYVGLSMGSRFGIPLAAELGEALRCAVFGKFGARQGSGLPAGLNTPSLMLAAARRGTASVLMHAQWDDQLFPRDGAFELFDAFASPDKVFVARPGAHAATHPDDEQTWSSFITHRLNPEH